MVQEYYVSNIRSLSAQRAKKRAEVQTPEQAGALVNNVRNRVLKCFGPLPERTALNERITGVLQRDSFRIEKLIFESRPNFPVTANLYIPDGADGNPGIIGACGHSSLAKGSKVYQSFAQALALKGFVVLLYDPLGQGERKQYADMPYPEVAQGGTREHNKLGNVMQLCGDFLGTWRAWDGIRALDYLLARPEVDQSRIGVTGNSGGGTLTCYLNALEERFTMAAPSCFVTTYRHNIENEEAQDSEQNPPGFLAEGLDMADFFIARAPRPTILLGQDNDFFDKRGLEESYREIQKIYRLLGAEKNVEQFVGPDSHGYHQANREAMYGFFCARAGLNAPAEEPQLALENEAALNCTESGQVISEKKPPKRVYQFTAEKARALKTQRRCPNREFLIALAADALALGGDGSVPYHRVLRPDRDPAENTVLSRYAVETEPGISSILFQFGTKPAFSIHGAGTVRLYVPHLGTRYDYREGIIPRSSSETALFSLDTRGSGEARPLTCGLEEDFFAPYDSDYMYACIGSFLKAPYLGGAVHDVLDTLRLLQAHGVDGIELEGRGLGAVKSAFAGLLAGDMVKSVRLYNPLLSYHELTQAPFYRWPFSTFIPGVLEKFDLPDIYHALEGKLELIDPWNAEMEDWDEMQLREHARSIGIPEAAIRTSRS